MVEKPEKWQVLTLTIFMFFNIARSAKTPLTKKTYIVQMDKSAKPESFSNHIDWYSSKVQSVLIYPENQEDGGEDQQRVIYTYQNAFHGVAARLSEQEAERLEEQDGVLAIFPETKYELHTTRSPLLTPTQLKVFTKYSNRSCKNNLASPGDLNYPALSVVFPDRTNVSVLTLHRTVTNVGPAVSNYHAIVSPFKGAYVKVEPRTLKFTKANQKLSYKIIFTTKSRQAVPEFGGLVWKDGAHRVRSPIVVVWLPPL
ncbi:unnamed protein product [Malus baccata var. baccata]